MKQPQPSVAQPPTILEAATGSLVTEVGLTVATTIAAASLPGAAALLLPLLPVLTKALASGRQELRMKANLQAIERILLEHEAALVHISDEQYALINEVVVAAMGSTSETKLKYLRNAVHNVLTLSELPPQEAVVLGRVVRDVSADEARFLMDHRDAERISIGVGGPSSTPENHHIDPASDEALCVYGLLSLGVLTPGEAAWDSMGLLGFSRRIAPKLVALLATPPVDAEH